MGAIVGLRRDVLKDEALTITDTSAQPTERGAEHALDRATTPEDGCIRQRLGIAATTSEADNVTR